MKNSKQNTLILANLILYIMETKTLQAIMNLAIWHVLNFTCKYFINIFCVRFLSLGQNTLLIHFKEGKLYYGGKFQGFKPWIICLLLWVMTRQKKHDSRERGGRNHTVMLSHDFLYTERKRGSHGQYAQCTGLDSCAPHLLINPYLPQSPSTSNYSPNPKSISRLCQSRYDPITSQEHH